MNSGGFSRAGGALILGIDPYSSCISVPVSFYTSERPDRTNKHALSLASR